MITEKEIREIKTSFQAEAKRIAGRQTYASELVYVGCSYAEQLINYIVGDEVDPAFMAILDAYKAARSSKGN